MLLTMTLWYDNYSLIISKAVLDNMLDSHYPSVNRLVEWNFLIHSDFSNEDVEHTSLNLIYIIQWNKLRVSMVTEFHKFIHITFAKSIYITYKVWCHSSDQINIHES